MIGLVAEVLPGDPPRVARTLKLPQHEAGLLPSLLVDAEAKEEAASGHTAALSSDGQTLFLAGRLEVDAVDLRRMARRGSWLQGVDVASVAATPDGRYLMAISWSRELYVIRTADGSIDHHVTIAVPGASSLLRVEAIS